MELKSSAGWLLLLYAVELKSSAGQPVLLYAVDLKGLLYAVCCGAEIVCCVLGLPYAVCRGAEVVVRTARLLLAAELLLFRRQG